MLPDDYKEITKQERNFNTKVFKQLTHSDRWRTCPEKHCRYDRQTTLVVKSV